MNVQIRIASALSGRLVYKLLKKLLMVAPSLAVLAHIDYSRSSSIRTSCWALLMFVNGCLLLTAAISDESRSYLALDYRALDGALDGRHRTRIS